MCDCLMCLVYLCVSCVIDSFHLSCIHKRYGCYKLARTVFDIHVYLHRCNNYVYTYMHTHIMYVYMYIYTYIHRRYGCYEKARTVFDIHNMGYCGNFKIPEPRDLGLPDGILVLSLSLSLSLSLLLSLSLSLYLYI